MFNKVVGMSVVIVVAMALPFAPAIVLAEGKAPKSAAQVAAVEVARPLNPVEQETILSESQRVKSNLELWPARVREKLNAVKERLEDLDLHEIKGQRLMVSDFDELLDLVDEEAAAIEEIWGSVKVELSLWREALAKAPASYRSLAQMYEAKAVELEDESLKLHYADMASVSRAFAERYEAQASQMGAEQQKIERQMAFVGRARKFIYDMKQFLKSLPATEEGASVESFCRRLNDFIKTFEESVKLLKGMADKLGEEKKPAKEPATSAAPTAAAKASPVKPLTPDEFQSRLAKLRR